MSAPGETSPFSLERFLNSGQSPLDRYLHTTGPSSPNVSLSDILRARSDGSPLLRAMIQDQVRSMNFAGLASSPVITSEPLTLADLIKSEAKKEVMRLLSTGQLKDPNCKCCFKQCPCKQNSTPRSSVPVLSGPGPELQAKVTVTDPNVFLKKHPEHRRFMTICRNEVNRHGFTSYRENPVLLQESIHGIIRKMPGQLADTPNTKDKIRERINKCIVQKQNYGNKRNRKDEAKKAGIPVKRLKSTFLSFRGQTKEVTNPLPKMPPTPTGSEDEQSDIEDAIESRAVAPNISDKPGTPEAPKKDSSEQRVEMSAPHPCTESPVSPTKPEDLKDSAGSKSGDNISDKPGTPEAKDSAISTSGDILQNRYGLKLSVGDIVAIPKKSGSNYFACKIQKIMAKKIKVLYMKIGSGKDKSLKEPKGGKAYERFHMNAAVYKFNGDVISEEEDLKVKEKCAEFCKPGK